MGDMGAEAVALLLEIIAVPGTVPCHRLYSPPISLRFSAGPGRAG